MVGRLPMPLQDLDLAPQLGGDLGQQAVEHFHRDQAGTAAGHENSVGVEQAQGQRLETAVAAALKPLKELGEAYHHYFART